MVLTGGIVTFLLLAAARSLWGAGYAIAVMLGVSMLVGALIVYLTGHAYDDSTEKRIRQYLVEQLHGSATVRCEVELRSSGLWIRQDGVEHLYLWTDVNGIEETSIGVEIAVKSTLLVVRSRAFPSPVERDNFLQHARRLASTSMSGTSAPTIP